MNKILIIPAMFIVINVANAQVEEETLGQMVDRVTYAWDTEAEDLESYDGLLEFCKSADFRKVKIDLLNEIHHIDSVLYDRALIAQKRSDDKEITKLIKDIEKFEQEYSMKSFIKFLSDECKAQRAIEKDSKDLRAEIGSESYDSQVYMIELDMQKFVKHITKRVDLVRKHVHKLEIK